MSGRTISEIIIAKAAGRDVKPGEITTVKVDLALMPDTTPRRIMGDFKELGSHLFDPNRVVVVMDHYCPPKDIYEAEIEFKTRRWAESVNLRNVYQFEGVCHTVVTEKGHVTPGILMVGSDSHTCTAGALGAFAVGVGATDMLGVLSTGETWLVVPETIAINWEGRLQPGVMAKDMSLHMLKFFGLGGANWKVLELRGDSIPFLCIDERITLTNMAIETGATTAIIEPDRKVFAYLKNRTAIDYSSIYSDGDADYHREIHFHSEELKPLVACPDRPDNVTEANMLEDVKIDQAYIGSCTGGKYHDIEVAAQILKGKTIAPWVRLLVCPASKEVLKKIEQSGILHVLLQSGVTLVTPGCGACAGHRDGILAASEVCISSTNRNFKGRMGSPQSKVYLASSATVAASAINGYISDPRVLLA
jgi:3-isopropylmalate/(R)-2-methylmalate dehydratase large subunit